MSDIQGVSDTSNFVRDTASGSIGYGIRNFLFYLIIGYVKRVSGTYPAGIRRVSYPVRVRYEYGSNFRSIRA